MIPWSEVDGTTRYQDAVYPVDLQEHWLRLVDNGPNMATWTLDSPMLELAHERQFVVSQQGGDSMGFQDQHVDRIKQCLSVLDQPFHDTTGWRACNFYDVPDVDHVGLWTVGQSFKMPAVLDIPHAESTSHLPRPPRMDIKSPLIATPRSSCHQSKTSALPFAIEVGDSSMSDGPETTFQCSSFRYPRGPEDNRSTHNPPTRALKSVRLRKRSYREKKNAPSSCVHKASISFKTLGKYPMCRSDVAMNALASTSAFSLSTPPTSGLDDSDYEEMNFEPSVSAPRFPTSPDMDIT